MFSMIPKERSITTLRMKRGETFYSLLLKLFTLVALIVCSGRSFQGLQHLVENLCWPNLLLEANDLYREMDKFEQEMGLKVLVSLCKKYEKLLGSRYTLQTCVWYHVEGIENLFYEMCEDLNNEVNPSGTCAILAGKQEIPKYSQAKSYSTEEPDTDCNTEKIIKKSDQNEDIDCTATFCEKNAECQVKKANNKGSVNCDNNCLSDDCKKAVSANENHWHLQPFGTGPTSGAVDKSKTEVIKSVNKKETDFQMPECISEVAPMAEDNQFDKNISNDGDILEIDIDFGKIKDKTETKQENKHSKQKYKHFITNNSDVKDKADSWLSNDSKSFTFSNRKRKQIHPKRKPNPLKIVLKKRVRHNKGWYQQLLNQLDDAIKTVDGNNQSGNTDIVKSKINNNNSKLEQAVSSTSLANCSEDVLSSKVANTKKSSKKSKLRKTLNIKPTKVLILQRPDKFKSIGSTPVKENDTVHTIETGFVSTADHNESFTPHSYEDDFLGNLVIDCDLDDDNNTSETVPHGKGNESNITKDQEKTYGFQVKTTDIQKQRHACHLCDKTFSRKKILYRHYKSHPEGKFACQRCGNFMNGQEELDTHMGEHSRSRSKREQDVKHVDGTNTVTVGNVTRKQQGEAQNSQDLKTSEGEIPCVCTVCRVSFNSMKGLNKHYKTYNHCMKAGTPHPERKYLCQNCGKAYFKKHVLKRHMRSHFGEKQHVCSHCGYKCLEANNLKRHMALHFEVTRDFVCELCGAAFHVKKTLEAHCLYKHNNDRHFKCTHCSRAFKGKSELQRHEKIHTLEKKHTCFCGSGFHRVCNLRRHLRLVHGNNNYLPPINHVELLDFHKKKPLSKTDLANQFGSSVTTQYEESHDTRNLDMSECTEMGHTELSQSTEEGGYSMELHELPQEETHYQQPQQQQTSDLHVPDNSTTSIQDYAEEDVVDSLHKPRNYSLEQAAVTRFVKSTNDVHSNHTGEAGIHSADNLHNPIPAQHDLPQQLQHMPNREMFCGNFYFPQFSNGIAPPTEQPTPILPHINMLQNQDLRDNLQMSLNKPPAKFTFTLSNPWQRLVPNDFDSGYREMDNNIRFQNPYVENPFLVAQRLVNHDQRNAVQNDIYTRFAQEELAQRYLQGSQRLDHMVTPDKTDSESSYTAYPYRPTCSDDTGQYEQVTDKSSLDTDHTKDSEYLQSRHEMAAESLAQMAALAMDGNFQYPSTEYKNQML